jgi:hypothetical protein
MALVRTMHDVDYKEQDTLVSLKTALDWRACAMRVVIKKMATCKLHTVDIPTSATINCTLKNAKTPIAIVMIFKQKYRITNLYLLLVFIVVLCKSTKDRTIECV